MRQADIIRHRDEPVKKVGTWQDYIERDMSTDWEAVEARLSGELPNSSPDAGGGFRSTTHISAIDASGLSVAISTSPGATGGYVIGETGILTNNILGERDLSPAGFHSLPPGTRLSSMMSPTIVDAAAGQRLVLGSAGSSRIRSAIFQVISNVLDWSLDADTAVNSPRVHFEDDRLQLEHGYLSDTADALDERGYQVARWREKNLYFGGAHVALRHPDGQLSGAGDVRRGGAVVRVD
jgi:gamma-glutamyltranspeptidase/glutathione hydrolase